MLIVKARKKVKEILMRAINLGLEIGPILKQIDHPPPNARFTMESMYASLRSNYAPLHSATLGVLT